MSVAQEYEAGCGGPAGILSCVSQPGRGAGAGGCVGRGLLGCESQLGATGSHGAGDTGHGAGQQGQLSLQGGWMLTKQFWGEW